MLEAVNLERIRLRGEKGKVYKTLKVVSQVDAELVFTKSYEY